MTAPAADAIQARHRPGAIALFWACRLFVSLLVAWPLADVFRGLGVGRGPEQDAPLFEPGALLLLEAVRLGEATFTSALQTAGFQALVFALLLLAPLAALMVALSQRGRLEPALWFGRALRHLPRFVLLGGITLLCQALTLLAFVLVYGLLQRLWEGRVNEKWADLLSVAWFAIGAASVVVWGLLNDLGRAASVLHEERAADSIARAIGALRARPGRIAGTWTLVGLACVAVVALAAYATDAAHVEHPDSWRVVLVAFVHQLGALALAALRAVWLAFAIRVVAVGLGAGAPSRGVEPR
ncbi:MAG TPA: hypothetical protein VK524_14200 [Polyangiaceae bacterium]|nr:hypothetical protein [Polyangiaceae bacterium]